jgi:hypothetical protein
VTDQFLLVLGTLFFWTGIHAFLKDFIRTIPLMQSYERSEALGERRVPEPAE